MNNVEKFTKIKKQLEQAKQDKSEATGELNVLMKQLKKDYGVTTVPQAQKKLKQLLAEEETLSQQFDDLVIQLENDYNW